MMLENFQMPAGGDARRLDDLKGFSSCHRRDVFIKGSGILVQRFGVARLSETDVRDVLTDATRVEIQTSARATVWGSA